MALSGVEYTDFNVLDPALLPAKRAFQYTDLNIGVEHVAPIKRVVQYTDFNVGLEPVDIREPVQYVDFNVGFEPKPHIAGEYLDFNIHLDPAQYQRGVYLDFNIDPDASPVPHIWFVRPQYGKEGLIYNIIGMGFGTSRAEFDGRVMLNDLESETSQWGVVPASTSKALRISRYSQAELLTHIHWISPRSLTPLNANEFPTPYDMKNVITLQTGDIIEYDYIERSAQAPQANEAHLIPFFHKVTSLPPSAGVYQAWDTGVRLSDIKDQNGVAMDAPFYPGLAARAHRRFTVPAGLNGMMASNFGVGILGMAYPDRPLRAADFVRYVVRRADGTVKLWVTPDNDASTDLRYGQFMNLVGSVQAPTDVAQVGFVNSPGLPSFIDGGATNVEHEWIVAIVPQGAESGMVKVILDGA